MDREAEHNVTYLPEKSIRHSFPVSVVSVPDSVVSVPVLYRDPVNDNKASFVYKTLNNALFINCRKTNFQIRPL